MPSVHLDQHSIVKCDYISDKYRTVALTASHVFDIVHHSEMYNYPRFIKRNYVGNISVLHFLILIHTTKMYTIRFLFDYAC